MHKNIWTSCWKNVEILEKDKKSFKKLFLYKDMDLGQANKFYA